jgi:hypothetical protein
MSDRGAKVSLEVLWVEASPLRMLPATMAATSSEGRSEAPGEAPSPHLGDGITATASRRRRRRHQWRAIYSDGEESDSQSDGDRDGETTTETAPPTTRGGSQEIVRPKYRPIIKVPYVVRDIAPVPYYGTRRNDGACCDGFFGASGGEHGL